jgi:hypothetical protein
MNHKCKFCGRKFESNNVDAKYCTKQCKYSFDRVWHISVNDIKFRHLKVFYGDNPPLFSKINNSLNNKFQFRICSVCGREYNYSRLEKYCSKECLRIAKPRRITCTCLVCGKTFERKLSSAGKFCCPEHKGIYTGKVKGGYENINPGCKSVEWSKEISYIIGIIASDGNICRQGNTVKITNNDNELLNQISEYVSVNIVGYKLDIKKEHKHCNGKTYTTYKYRITNKLFYNFCLSIGLTPNKSRSIGKIDVPLEYFSDFLRGVIDGDGNYNIQKRQSSVRTINYIYIRITSGSIQFLEWINSTCFLLLGFEGSITKDSGKECCYTLMWTSEKKCNSIISFIYSDCNFYLKRKWDKLQNIKEQLNIKHTFLKNNELPIKSI